MQFRKAERKKAKLRLGITGPAGSGKTRGTLEIAKGLGGKVAFIDTEAGSGELYADVMDYDILRITAPFTPAKYVEAIRAAEQAGYDVIIVDSLTHAWSGDGGVLDRQAKWAAQAKENSYTAWRHVTPEHNSLVEAMLQSPCHVIATMRSKTEYELQENDQGKKVPVKIGLAPVQREGMDYEMTVVLDVDFDHNAKASKDRTRLFADPIPFRITEEIGKRLKDWLESGVERKPSCTNCAKKGVDVDANEETDGMALCGGCAEKWSKMKIEVSQLENERPAVKPEQE